jgi:hypothetical protein
VALLSQNSGGPAAAHLELAVALVVFLRVLVVATEGVRDGGGAGAAERRHAVLAVGCRNPSTQGLWFRASPLAQYVVFACLYAAL